MKKRDYSEFKNIGVFDTGLIENNGRNRICFEKNGVVSLADLFEKDDEGSLIFSYSSNSSRELQVFLNIARCKYLGEDLHLCNNPYKKYNEITLRNAIETSLGIKGTNYHLADNYFCRELYTILSEASWHFSSFGNDDAEFSFMDVFTNEDIIYSLTNTSRRSDYNKSCFRERMLFYLDYYTKKKEKDITLENTTDLSVLLREEKRLIEELSRLTEQSNKLKVKIEEIQQLKNSEIAKRSL